MHLVHSKRVYLIDIIIILSTRNVICNSLIEVFCLKLHRCLKKYGFIKCLLDHDTNCIRPFLILKNESMQINSISSYYNISCLCFLIDMYVCT